MSPNKSKNQMFARASNWENNSDESILACKAALAYAHEYADTYVSVVPEIAAEPPKHQFTSSRKSCDSACYKIYSDGSLWYVNNSQDEVWLDYTEFVIKKRLDVCRKSEWDDLNEMDQGILSLYFGFKDDAEEEIDGEVLADSELANPTAPPRRCVSCGAELGADWDKATVHIDRESGITCGGKIEG